MKKGLIILVVVVVILIFGWMSIYNSLVTKDEKINQNQAEIDNQLKRRADLIPNLISTVKGLTSQELALVEAVTSARVKMTTGTTQEKLAGNEALTTSINVLVENYPVLKSDTAFVGLMDELAGSENRVANAKKAYNDEVGSFNTTIKRFPSSIVASMSGFSTKTYLETTEADKALPNVQF
ncbi:MAG: LemA family protein [Clostridia bacterium]|nr:LemA family protein [Clostridia bacterium]MDD4387457.1 LemA family protein [Clostridia bacterium]